MDALRYARAVEAYDAALDADPAGPSAPGAHFGRANAFEGLASKARAEAEGDADADADADAESRRLYALAVDDYSRCVALAPEAAEVSTAYFERAQAERALGRWKDAREDYDAAATRFLARREKKFADVSDAQAAFATFETGDLTRARARLETLGRRLYSSDVRAALVACYWRMGEGALAEDAWSKLCEMKDSRCGKYGDRDWLVSYRRWTPGLADAMEDFLALRVRPGWGGEGGASPESEEGRRREARRRSRSAISNDVAQCRVGRGVDSKLRERPRTRRRGWFTARPIPRSRAPPRATRRVSFALYEFCSLGGGIIFPWLVVQNRALKFCRAPRRRSLQFLARDG